jgi:phosphoserine phosphatase RsbU/P
VSGLLRTLAHRRRTPGQLLKLINEVLLERKVDAQYVTLTVLQWEARDRRVVMANAGAIPPMVCRGGEIIKPHVEGIPAGLLEGSEYDELTLTTQPGDVILFFSDGIEDQPNPNGEEYGRARLAHALRRVCDQTSNGIADAMLADLDAFTAGARAFDDQTIIAMKVL